MTTDARQERPHDDLGAVVAEAAAAAKFSGVVRIDQPGRPIYERAFGLADRRWAVPFSPDTITSIASATKGFTGLTVMSLIESGELSLGATARSLLGNDLPLIDDRVTVEHLLAHRSGIGDYLDEEAMGDISDYAMSVPVQQLDSTESYLAVLDGHPQVSVPGERFAYNNGGFVVLALLAERASGVAFEQLVVDRICHPAGLRHTTFLRADSLPAGVATGYLFEDGMRTNSLHLPLVGSGDGGLVSTVADIRLLWQAVFAGRIVSVESVARMARSQSYDPGNDRRYGLGLWLHAHGPQVYLEGYDAGISFGSWHDPTAGGTQTVIANTSNGAWPVLRAIRAATGPT